MESGKSQISVELSEERKRREEETMLLARKLAEKTHVADKARQKAIDAENEVRYLYIISIEFASFLRHLGHFWRLIVSSLFGVLIFLTAF